MNKLLVPIGREAGRLTRLLSLVLDPERYESGQASLARAPLALAEVAREAREAVGQLTRERGCAPRLDVPATLPPVPADRDRLRQVLINLLSHASKAGRPGQPGRIAVRAWLAAGALGLCVEDKGKGIAAAGQARIFDKFYQARPQTMREPEGSGLGLALSKKSVEPHQGRLWVERAPEQGARFFSELPLGDVARAPAPWRPPAPATPFTPAGP